MPDPLDPIHPYSDGQDFNPSQQGKKFLDKALKEGFIQGPAPTARTNTRQFGRGNGTGETSYDVRDEGNTDFGFDEIFTEPYNAIEVQSTGTLEVITATGDRTMIDVTSTETGQIEPISVQRVVEDGTDIALSDIILYRE